jgi:Tfp pilus assembly protein PilX
VTKRSGFLLISTLLILTVLLVAGFGLLTSQEARYAAVGRSAEIAQARAMAMAGLEDCRLKIQNDASFPPEMGPGQTVFSYKESMPIPTVPPTLANYQVLVDTSHAIPPYLVLVVTSIGSLGPDNRPTAQYSLKAEVDISEFIRGSSTPNPKYCKYTHIEDESSL